MSNIYIQIQRVLFDSGVGTSAFTRYPRSRIIDWLQRAEGKMLAYLQVPSRTSTNITATAFQRHIGAAAPQGFDLLGHLIDRVIFTDSAGNDLYLLETTEPEMDQVRDGWRNTTQTDSAAVPRHYWFNPRLNRLYFDPIPGYAGNTAIEFTRRPYRTARIYDSGAASAVYGTSTITGTNTQWTGAKDLAAGMAFGIMAPTETGVDDDPIPVRWYTIASIGGNTSLSLTEAWAETDRPSCSYVIASKSAFTDKYEHLSEIAVYSAMAQMFRAEGDNEAWQQHKALFESEMQEAMDSVAVHPNYPATFGFAGGISSKDQDGWTEQIQGRR